MATGAAVSRRDGAASIRPANPWTGMAVVIAGTIMVVLDTTIVNVALPKIGEDLGVGSKVEWVVSAYLLAVAVSQPVTGWLASRIGRKTVFLVSLVAFTVASAAAAAAPNLEVLVGVRVLQGLGGGAMVPVGMAMILELFPRERHGRAIAIWGMAAMVGPAVGPTLGGWLVTAASWHWLFLINVPIGVGALAFGARLLPDLGHRSRLPLDGLGLLLAGGGLALGVLGLSEGNTWGWSSVATAGCLVAAPILLLAFVLHELRVHHPMIEMRMFRERTFSLAMSVMLFVTGAQYARLVFVPLELESLRGLSAFRVGLLFVPAALAQAAGMYLGGRLVDRTGARAPIVVGCAVAAVAVIGFANLTLTTSIVVFAVLLAVQGVGVGLTNAPTMVAGVSDLPPHLLGQGTAVRALVSQVAGAAAVASLGAVVDSHMGSNPLPAHAQAAYNDAFVAAAVGAVFAVGLAVLLPAVRRRPALATEPTIAVEVA